MSMIKKVLAILISISCAFSVFGCAKDEGDGIVGPEGYTREVGENMFWEAEDTVEKNTVVPDVGIRIYNYCPSVIDEGDVRHVWYCSNKYTDGFNPEQDISGDEQITDYVAYRKGVKVEGVWFWSQKQYLFGPIKGSSTEGEHICDPNVIKGEFSYRGESYSYLMAYLAVGRRDCDFNNINLAVANAPEGPWIRCHDINPIVEFSADEVPQNMLDRGVELWGVGQPSMISVDKKGRVLMFYSYIAPYFNGTAWTEIAQTEIQRFDFSDLNDIKVEFRKFMPITGLKSFGYQVGNVTNADYAYDPVNNRIFTILDGGYSADFKGTDNTLGYVENKSKNKVAEVGDVFNETDWKSENISWVTVAGVKPNDTVNYISAHNNAIIRDPYGWLSSPTNIELAITGSCIASNFSQIHPDAADKNIIWSFRILRKSISLQN